MRVALAQVRSGSDPSANLELITDHLDRAAGQAELIVFPEATMSSFAGAAHRAAQPLDGPWASRVRELAAEAGLTVVAGMFTPGAGRARNTLLVTGAAETHYDKLHLFDAFGQAESDDIEPGAALASFSLGTHQVGLATCYDVRFPSLFTSLARGGAEVIVLPASWASGPGKLHQWRTLVTARAMDSTSFVVAVDQAAAASTSSASGVGSAGGAAGSASLGAGASTGSATREGSASGLGSASGAGASTNSASGADSATGAGSASGEATRHGPAGEATRHGRATGADSASGEATRHGSATGIGHSMVVGPSGEVLLELGDGPELAFIDLDLSEVPATRLRLPVLAHTRPLP